MEQHSRTEHVNQRQLYSVDRTTTYALREHKQDHRRSICKPQWSRDHCENKRDLLRCCREWNNQCLTNDRMKMVNNQRRTNSTISSRETKNEWSRKTRYQFDGYTRALRCAFWPASLTNKSGLLITKHLNVGPNERWRETKDRSYRAHRNSCQDTFANLTKNGRRRFDFWQDMFGNAEESIGNRSFKVWLSMNDQPYWQRSASHWRLRMFISIVPKRSIMERAILIKVNRDYSCNEQLFCMTNLFVSNSPSPRHLNFIKIMCSCSRTAWLHSRNHASYG